MVLSGAERARRCREKKKRTGLSEIAKQKDRLRKQAVRSKMSSSQLAALRLRQHASLRKFREKTATAPIPSSLDTSHFVTKQAKAKALKKMKQALPANKNKQIELIHKIAEDLNVLQLEKKYERNYQSIPLEVKKKVFDYYCRDDISYQSPGKRDTITVKENGAKLKLQRRYLLFSLRELYQLFVQENPQIKLSLSSFQDLRPSNVLYKSSIPHNVCVCIYHENISLLLQALSKYIHGLERIDLHSFINLIVCDPANELCMFGNCTHCINKFKIEINDKIINPTLKIKWMLWSISEQGRYEKIDYEGSVLECVTTLQEKIDHFLFHVFVKRQQSSYFETLKANVTDKKCLIQLDYAENFAVIDQNEIQSAHWSRQQISLFTVYIWTKSFTQPMVIVSDDISHNKFTVSQCLEHVLKHLQLMIPLLQEVIIFSDGCASQFKQRYLFKNLSFLADKYKIGLSWNFFASNHGKDKNNSIIIEELLVSEIQGAQKALNLLFDNVRAVPNIQKIHSMTVVRSGEIELKIYANSAEKKAFHF
ncbi:unnamed protein product [Adineta ricciae]|uniref:Uncharacterized protein n=1 Tax=Adineta ricciae TaxID=249248 RepID=A0A815UZ00_ADIRI|nr:unnamed protein product [Adineta ricciae]